jgi:hypothetical protein
MLLKSRMSLGESENKLPNKVCRDAFSFYMPIFFIERFNVISITKYSYN